MNDIAPTKTYAFLLIPGFSTLGFSCALEALSLANHHPSGRKFYRWRLMSEAGAPVEAYNGVKISVDSALAPLERGETLIVCAGENAGRSSSKTVLNWLRREARRGGDIGALSIGAALGTVAVIVRQELVVLVMGGIFVLETASVILQVASFKLTGKRIFRMAPIHHHFELKGWAEPKVIVRFWIITFFLVLAGLATLKLR